MKKLFNISAITFAAMAIFASCAVKHPEVVLTDKGPDMTVSSCDASAYMGADIHFAVTLQDKDFALSTLKVQLLFDESVVSEKTIRTKEYGTYEDVINVPLYASVPDGTAKIVFTAQNVGTGISTKSAEVSVTRPNFDAMTMVTEDGKKYEMTKTGDYCYAYTGSFDSKVKAKFVTPAVNDKGETITIAWQNSALTVNGNDYIPFYQGNAGVYTISIDLLNFSAAPFGKTEIAFTQEAPAITAQLCQGTQLIISGADAFSMDPDYFSVNGTTVIFRPVSGNYKMVADYTNKFIRVDRVDDNGEYFSDFDQQAGIKAIYCIGGGIGKGKVSESWSTTTGAWALAEQTPGVYEITFKAGRDFNNGAGFKFFCSRGWGGELLTSNYATVNLGDWCSIAESSGDITANNLQLGKGYTFTIDVTGGFNAAAISLKEIDLPAEGLDIKINGTQALMIDENHYCAPSVNLTKGATLTADGIDNFSEYWLDPDFIVDGKFNAMDGYYMVDVYLDKKYLSYKRLDSPNGSKATTSTHAVWLMGWGVANRIFSLTGREFEDKESNGDNDADQLAWNPGSSYCMAEVSDNVYQFSGYAVKSTDTTTLAGRFRYDFLSIKWFGQDGWGDEKGKIYGPDDTVKYTERALELLDGATGNDNVSLKDGVTLELGAYYVLTIDLSTSGVELIDFYKK